MKTDRELLELAAKAAGYKGLNYDGLQWEACAGDRGILVPWNPLKYEGDALRLAVKLRITVEWAAWNDDLEEVRADDSIEPIDQLINEECAATRRAIVRAAAAIGEAMR